MIPYTLPALKLIAHYTYYTETGRILKEILVFSKGVEQDGFTRYYYRDQNLHFPLDSVTNLHEAHPEEGGQRCLDYAELGMYYECFVTD